MPHKLSKLSEDRLKGVHPNLINVVRRAIELSAQDFMVIEGVRSLSRQQELYAQGRTRPGKIVTWTMKSQHLVHPNTGFGHAVDLAPYPKLFDASLVAFDAVARAMMAASKELHIPIRWGADWDGDGLAREKKETDSPHFELDM